MRPLNCNGTWLPLSPVSRWPKRCDWLGRGFQRHVSAFPPHVCWERANNQPQLAAIYSERRSDRGPDTHTPRHTQTQTPPPAAHSRCHPRPTSIFNHHSVYSASTTTTISYPASSSQFLPTPFYCRLAFPPAQSPFAPLKCPQCGCRYRFQFGVIALSPLSQHPLDRDSLPRLSAN